jgi:hypothetical protein
LISVRSEVQVLPGPPIELEALSGKLGALSLALSGGGVAQSGERLLCKQEVDGSIPFASTTGAARRHRATGAAKLRRERRGARRAPKDREKFQACRWACVPSAVLFDRVKRE